MQNAKCKMQNWQRSRGKRNAKCKIVLFDCRGDLRSPEVVSVTAVYPSVTKKHDLQKPSLVREGGRQTELAECRLTDE